MGKGRCKHGINLTYYCPHCENTEELEKKLATTIRQRDEAVELLEDRYTPLGLEWDNKVLKFLTELKEAENEI